MCFSKINRCLRCIMPNKLHAQGVKLGELPELGFHHQDQGDSRYG